MKLFKSANDNSDNNNQRSSNKAPEINRNGILIVDDSRFSRKILKDILKNEGYLVVGEASDGLEAVEMTKQKKPEYIFMDVEMPKLDGLGAIPRILEIDSGVHIIMCTALGQKNIMVEAAKAGAKDFVIKPYTKDNIISVLDVIVKAKQKDLQAKQSSEKHSEENKNNNDSKFKANDKLDKNRNNLFQKNNKPQEDIQVEQEKEEVPDVLLEMEEYLNPLEADEDNIDVVEETLDIVYDGEDLQGTSKDDEVLLTYNPKKDEKDSSKTEKSDEADDKDTENEGKPAEKVDENDKETEKKSEQEATSNEIDQENGTETKAKDNTTEAETAETNATETKSVDTNADETKSDEEKSDEIKSNEVKSDEVKIDEIKTDEVKSDDAKSKEDKVSDENSAEVVKPAEEEKGMVPEEEKKEQNPCEQEVVSAIDTGQDNGTELKAEEVKADETKIDETKTDEAKTDDIKTDETKTDEAKSDEVKSEVTKADTEEKPAEESVVKEEAVTTPNDAQEVIKPMEQEVATAIDTGQDIAANPKAETTEAAEGTGIETKAVNTVAYTDNEYAYLWINRFNYVKDNTTSQYPIQHKIAVNDLISLESNLKNIAGATHSEKLMMLAMIHVYFANANRLQINEREIAANDLKPYPLVLENLVHSLDLFEEDEQNYNEMTMADIVRFSGNKLKQSSQGSRIMSNLYKMIDDFVKDKSRRILG